MICRYQVTKLFCSTWSFASASPARSFCYFCPPTYIAISVFWEGSATLCFLNFVATCTGCPSPILGNCVRVHALVCPQDYPRKPLTSMEDLPTDRSHLCHFSGIPVPVSRWLVRYDAVILNLKMSSKQLCFQRLGLLPFINDSCGSDVRDELPPEMVHNPGTTRGTKLFVLQIRVFPVGVNRGP